MSEPSKNPRSAECRLSIRPLVDHFPDVLVGFLKQLHEHAHDDDYSLVEALKHVVPDEEARGHLGAVEAQVFPKGQVHHRHEVVVALVVVEFLVFVEYCYYDVLQIISLGPPIFNQKQIIPCIFIVSFAFIKIVQRSFDVFFYLIIISMCLCSIFFKKIECKFLLFQSLSSKRFSMFIENCCYFLVMLIYLLP